MASVRGRRVRLSVWALLTLLVGAAATFTERPAASEPKPDLPKSVEWRFDEPPQVSSATVPGSVEWRFSEPQPDWQVALPPSDMERARLERTTDALRVVLSNRPPASGESPTNGILSGGVYVDLPAWRREQWAEVVVQVRSSGSVTHMRLGLNSPDPASVVPPGGFGATFSQRLPSPVRPGFRPGGETPLVRDGLVHTYRIHPDWGWEPTGPWQRVGLWFEAFAPGGVDILSVRVVPAATGPSPHRVRETTLQPSQLQADFALFRAALEEAHPALYRYTTKEALDARFAAAEARLTRPMTILQFRNVLAPILAAVKDGHLWFTTYRGDEISAVLASAKQFPLALTFEEDRALVLLNQGIDDRVKPGMEVLAINGTSMQELLKSILPNLTHDGDAESWPLYQLGMWSADHRSRSFFQVGTHGRTGFGEAYRLFVGDPPSFRTTLRDPKTEQSIVVDLAGVTVAEATVNVERNAVNREVLEGHRALRIGIGTGGHPPIRYLDGEDTAVLADAFGANYPDVLKNAFAELRRRGTKNLIIDMRGNTGGFDIYPVLLFSYLTSTEFRAIEGNRVKTFEPSYRRYTRFEIENLATDTYFGPASGIWKPDPGGGWLMTEKYGEQFGSDFVGSIGVQQPSENHFDGPVYVLIDGGCFSACPAFTVLADFYKRATFIGDETGGTGSGGAGSDIGPTLPESHLHVHMSMESYFSLDGNQPRRGTLPTHAVRQTIDDLAKGRDTVLEFTLGLIRGGK